MEGLIVLGLIIWGVVSLFSNNKCKDGHDWTYDNHTHRCINCGTKGKHDSVLVEHDAWADENISTYTTSECSVCGCNHGWDND